MDGAVKTALGLLLFGAFSAHADLKTDCTIYSTGQERSVANRGLGEISPNGQHILRTDANGVSRLSEHPIEGKGDLRVAQFSPDSSKLLTGWSGGQFQLTEIASEKKLYEISLADEASLGVFSPTGNSFLVSDRAGGYQVFDTATGRKIGEGKQPKSLLWAEFSADGKAWVTTSSGTQVVVEHADSPKKLEFAHGAGVDRARFSADGKSLFTAARDNSARVIELETGKEVFQIPHRHWVKDAQPTPDGKFLVTSGADGVAQVTDVVSGIELGRLTHTGEVTEARISPDGKWLATSGAEGAVRISSLPAAKEHVTLRYVDRITSLAFSPDSRYLGLGTRDGWAKLVDITSTKGIASLKHGRPVTEVAFSADSHWFHSVSQRKILSHEIAPLCVEEDLKFFAAKSELTEGTAIHKKIRDTLCGQPFNEESWKTLAPDMAGLALPQAIAKSLLLRFQKPGGFEASRHLRSLLAILRSEFRTKEASLVRGALQTVAGTSPSLYAELFQKVAPLKDFPSSTEPSTDCRTEEEQKQVRVGILSYLTFLRELHEGRPTQWKDWASLAPLTPVLATLPPRNAEAQLREIGRSLGEGAAGQASLGALGVDLLARYATESAKGLFGRKACARTELVPSWGADRLSLRVIAVAPIDGEPEAIPFYGVYTKTLAEFPFAATEPAPRDLASLGMPAEFPWSLPERKFVGKLQKEPKEQGAIAQGPGLAWAPAKEKISGAILVETSGIDDGSAAELADRYLNYLVTEGFEVAPAREVPDVDAELAKGVKTGSLDYIAVEGKWAGGKGGWLIGAQKKGGERTEDLQLFFAKPGEGTAHPDLQGWIALREQAGKGPLLYVENFAGVSPVAPALDRPGIVGIFLASGSASFGINPGNPFRSVLTALREGKDFAGMRGALAENDGLGQRREAVFVFPDEPLYRRRVLERSGASINNAIAITLPDRENRAYVPEKACEEGG